MYIRRKVFSLLQDENGDERYFSTTDFEYEDELDDKLYSDKEKSGNKKRKKKLSTSAKIALEIGGATALTAGGLYAAKRGVLGTNTKVNLNDATLKLGKKIGDNKLGKKLQGSGMKRLMEVELDNAYKSGIDKLNTPNLYINPKNSRESAEDKIRDYYKTNKSKIKDISRSELGEIIKDTSKSDIDLSLLGLNHKFNKEINKYTENINK